MIFQFKIQIKGITKPPVWRRVTIDANSSFRDLHNLIQVSFGWTFSHLYSFSQRAFSGDYSIEDPEFAGDLFGEQETEDSTKVKLKDIFKSEKQKYVYVYDFGDSWEHDITLEKIVKDENLNIPLCITGKGQCPPEDCGGVWGYEELKEILKDPTHPDYDNMVDWLWIDEGSEWDPNEFDVDFVNDNLRNYWIFE